MMMFRLSCLISYKRSHSVIEMYHYILQLMHKSYINRIATYLPGHFRALYAFFCWQALWRCWFHFPAGLAPVHTTKCTKSWFNDHGVTVLDWPANAWPEPHRESMGYYQEEDERHQTQQCRWPEGRYQSNLGFITPEQCHRLIASMPRYIDAVIHAKGAQPSIECIEINILFRSLTFLVKISFFIDLM